MPRFLSLATSALLLAIVLTAGTAGADGGWLDGPVANWNTPGMAIPQAAARDPATDTRCFASGNSPVSRPEQAVADAGWTLYGARIAGLPIELVKGVAGFDGMCRPIRFQVFLFVDGKLAGTLSPVLMDSRSDGALTETEEQPADRIVGVYVRYTPQDPLCCPSARSTATFKIDRSGSSPLLLLQSVSTELVGAGPTPAPSPAPPTTPSVSPVPAPVQLPRGPDGRAN